MKILIVLPHLRDGGAQRVAVNLINNWGQNISPGLFLVNEDGFLFEQIKKNITITVSRGKKTRSIVPEIKKTIDENQYDLVLTMKEYLGLAVSLAVSLSRTRPPLLYREVIHKSSSAKYQARNRLQDKLWKTVARYVYKKADRVIVPSTAMKGDLLANYSLNEAKIEVINNPVDVKAIKGLAAQAVDHPWFSSPVPVVVGMGRLTTQKGFAVLIKAISILVTANTEVRLLLVGEGEEKAPLQNLVQELGLAEKVQFLGSRDNPYQYIARSDLFVLSSFYEGFPNALLEAMACAVPVIATNCESGPAEIIDSCQDGILVPVGDSLKMAEAIGYLSKERQLARQMAVNAARKVEKKYAAEIIAPQYERIFQAAIMKEQEK